MAVRGAPIRAFVGLNGSGKTLAAMEFCVVPALAAGRDVWSTCEIDHPNAHLVRSWRDLVKLRDCTLLLDEITSALPARQAMSLPPELARLFNQLRKVNVQMAWTAPNWARADKLLREVTGVVTVCRGMLPERRIVDEATGERVRAAREWPRNRLFRFKTYAAEDFDEFTLAKETKLKAVDRQFYWRSRHEAFKLYKTLDPVMLLDHVDDVGMCVGCGRKRKQSFCACTADERAAAVGALAPSGDALLRDDAQQSDPESVQLMAGVEVDEPDHERWCGDLVQQQGFERALELVTAGEPLDNEPLERQQQWQAFWADDAR